MQVHLFIGDIHLERIPQYSITSIKLHIEICDETITLSGKWSRKSRKIRFQDMVHYSVPTLSDGIELSFTLLALLSHEESDYRVIGSGRVHTCFANHAVQQTVMLSSSNMANLMARLFMTVTFEGSQTFEIRRYDGAAGDIYHDGSSLQSDQRQDFHATSFLPKRAADPPRMDLISKQTPENLRKNRSLYSGDGPLKRERGPRTDSSSSRNRLSANRYEVPHSNNEIEDDVNYELRMTEVVRGKDANSSSLSRRRNRLDDGSQISAERNSQVFVKSSRRLETFTEFTDRARSRADEKENLARQSQGTNVHHSVHIQTETMKQNEACERLRVALERKDEMLRRAQSQLDSSVGARSLEIKGGDYSGAERFLRSSQHRHGRDVPIESSLDHRAEKRLARQTSAQARRAKEADNRGANTTSAAINPERDWDCHDLMNTADDGEEVSRTFESLDASTRARASNTSLRVSGTLNASHAELYRAERVRLEAKEAQIEERRILEIRNRLQSAEDRRMQALREHKDRAALMASESTCKARAIKEAALVSRKAYDKLRNDFDRKEEMLRRVQGELETSSSSRRGGRGRMGGCLDRSSDSMLGSAEHNSSTVVRVTRAGEGEILRRRASSAPPRARAAPYPSNVGLSLPFSNLKMRSRSSNRGERATHRDNHPSSQRVHYIPSAPPSQNGADSIDRNGLRSGAYVQSQSAVPQRHPRNNTEFIVRSCPPSTEAAELNRAKKSEVGNASPTSHPSSNEADGALSRKSLALLVHQRVHALKQKIAESSPEEGESILRMLRNALPPIPVQSRAGKKGKRRKRQATHLVEGNAIDSSDGLEWIRPPSPRSEEEAFFRSAPQAADDDGYGEADEEETDDADSVETSALVAQLWDILGVTADYGPISKRAIHWDRSEEAMGLDVFQSAEKGNEERFSSPGAPGDALEVNRADEYEAPLSVSSSLEDHPNEHSFGLVRDDALDMKAMQHRVDQPSMSPVGAHEGRGERWWRSDYLALKGEIKNIIESASPIKGREGKSEATGGQHVFCIGAPSAMESSTMNAFRAPPHAPPSHSFVHSAPSFAPAKRHVAFSPEPLREAKGSHHRDPVTAVPVIPHDASNSQEMYSARPPYPPTAVKLEVFSSSSTPSKGGELNGQIRTPEDSLSDEEELLGDSFAVDTSACISRQIDDVGKAISTLQARIASYMYISPDASPGDRLISARPGLEEEDDERSQSEIHLVSGVGSPISVDDTRHDRNALDRSSQFSMAQARVEKERELEREVAMNRVLSAREILEGSVKGSNGQEGEGPDYNRGSSASVSGSESTPSCSDISWNRVYGSGTLPIEVGGQCRSVAAWKQKYVPATVTDSTAAGDVVTTFQLDPRSIALPTPQKSGASLRSDSALKSSVSNHTLQQARLGSGYAGRSGGTNMFHGIMYPGTGTATNTEEASVSVSVRDMDMGNLSYDAMSFAAERMMALGQSSLADLNNTEDLLKDIFGDDEDSDTEDDAAGNRKEIRYPPRPSGGDRDPDSDTDSGSDDFDGVFRLP